MVLELAYLSLERALWTRTSSKTSLIAAKKFDADIEKFERNQEKNSVNDQRLLTIMKSTAVEQSKRAIRQNPRYPELLQLDPLAYKLPWLYHLMIEATH